MESTISLWWWYWYWLRSRIFASMFCIKKGHRICLTVWINWCNHTNRYCHSNPDLFQSCNNDLVRAALLRLCRPHRICPCIWSIISTSPPGAPQSCLATRCASVNASCGICVPSCVLFGLELAICVMIMLIRMLVWAPTASLHVSDVSLL